MVTEATKKFRDIFAFGLLGVAALYVISGLSLLFKGQNDTGLDFAGRAAAFEHVFTDPVLVLSLVLAVALAAGWGQSRHARVIVVAALALGALALLLGLISWLAAFGADDGGNAGIYGGVLGAGKVVGFLIGLAQLWFLALMVLFAWTAFQALPKAVHAPGAGWNQGQQAYGGSWQQLPPQGGASAAPGGWTPTPAPYGQHQGYQQQAYPQQTGYPPQAQPVYGQPQTPQPGYGAQPTYGQPGQAPGPAGAPGPYLPEQTWGQPQQQEPPGQQSPSGSQRPATAASREQPQVPSIQPPPAHAPQPQPPPPQGPPARTPPPQGPPAQHAPQPTPPATGAHSADEAPAGAEEPTSSHGDDDHDQSGWWRPSP